MAHLSGGTSASVFSPSIARIDASTAKDWLYIDAWLASKFPPGVSIPDFERNPATLAALLTVASSNEAADENRALLARADEAAFKELSGHQFLEHTDEHRPNFENCIQLRKDLLTGISSYLNQEGIVALQALASTAVQYGIAFPDLENLSTEIVSTHSILFETEQMVARAQALKKYLDQETKRVSQIKTELKAQNYDMPKGLAMRNLEMQRQTKGATARLLGAQERLAAATQSLPVHATVQSVYSEEQQLLVLLAHKKELDAQMALFEGLSSDPKTARDDIRRFREQLKEVTSRRDEVFVGLVERASPAKHRTK